MHTRYPNAVVLDRTDRRTLHELQLDGALTDAQLAERVYKSESACRRHRHRLSEEGVMRYAVVVDQRLVGYPENVFVEITLESQNHMHLERFEAAVLDIDEVVACHALIGRCDYLLHVVVQSLEHYDQILKAQLTQLPGVSHLESHPALHQVVRKVELPVLADS